MAPRRVSGMEQPVAEARLVAVLLDVDGTLAETEERHRLAFNRAFAQCGLTESWSVDTYRRLLRITGGKERIAAGFRERGQSLAAGAVEQIHRCKTEHFVALMQASALALRPGVLRLLRGANAARLKLGLTTTTSPENVHALLAPHLGANWRGLFDVIVAGDQVVAKKPAPDVYRAALTALRLAPDQAVAIEDSRAGVQSARAAGIPVIATPSVFFADDDFSGATVVLPNLGDPDAPWQRRHPSFDNGWVEFADLKRLAGAERGRAAA